MESYVTWTDLFQLIIVLTSIGTLIVSIISINKKR